MSVSTNTAEPALQVLGDTSDNGQWKQEVPNVQIGTPSPQWTESPQQIPATVNSPATIPTYYNTNGVNFTGVTNAQGFVANNQHSHIERNGIITSNGIIMNGMRPINAMIRPNGLPPHLLNRNNGYINAITNGRYIRPPGWVPTNKPNGVKKQKRNRTAFTSHQMMELEQEYARTRYLDRNRRIELSEILRLNERTIKIWFQNRRMKEKKDKAESLEDSEEVSTTESSPELANGTIPLLIHDQYPVTVTNEMYNRAGLYMEQFPVSSTPSTMTTMPQNQMVNDFVEYIPENGYESQCRQVHLQVQHYNPAQLTGIQEVPSEQPQPDSCSTSAPSNISEQNWDLSWIRSIQADEDF